MNMEPKMVSVAGLVIYEERLYKEHYSSHVTTML